MDTTKNIERGARLGEFLDRKMLNKKEFSTITGISPSMISFYVLGSQPFTGRLIEAMEGYGHQHARAQHHANGYERSSGAHGF